MSPRLPGPTSPMLPLSVNLSPKMESLAIPSQQRRRTLAHHRQRSGGPAGPLRLPSLPRFHPANFPSQHTSAVNTPATGPNSPQPPVSPRTQQRHYSEAQRQLYLYQRELVTAARGPRTSLGTKPASPKLMPLAGSPGPVTPLELENEDGYLLAGHGSSSSLSEKMKSEIVEKLIREEASRLHDPTSSPSRMVAPVGSR